MNDAIDNFEIELDGEKTAIRIKFSALCSDINGTLRLTACAVAENVSGEFCKYTPLYKLTRPWIRNAVLRDTMFIVLASAYIQELSKRNFPIK